MSNEVPAYGEGTYDYATATWSWSPEMYTVLGLAPSSEDPSALVFARMHPDDRPRVQEVLDKAIREGRPFSGQYRLRDDRGRERAIAFVADAVHDAQGRPVRLEGRAFDVTAGMRHASTEAVAAATADRAAIEQVKGALMAAYGIAPDAAFGLLVRYSQRSNVKVSDLARGVAARLAQPRAALGPRSMMDLLDAESAGARTRDKDLAGET